MTDLGSVIGSAREDLVVFKRTGAVVQADYLEKLLDEVKESAEDYLVWLSEDSAVLKSGLSQRTLRRRFRELLDCELARYGVQGQREYRSCAIPPRPDAATARAAALAGESLQRAS